LALQSVKSTDAEFAADVSMPVVSYHHAVDTNRSAKVQIGQLVQWLAVCWFQQ
jgi:hypothetical protein